MVLLESLLAPGTVCIKIKMFKTQWKTCNWQTVWHRHVWHWQGLVTPVLTNHILAPSHTEKEEQQIKRMWPNDWLRWKTTHRFRSTT